MLCAQLHFHDDVQEPPLELFHKLKLYADADPTNQGTKKPVRSHATPAAAVLRAVAES